MSANGDPEALRLCFIIITSHMQIHICHIRGGRHWIWEEVAVHHNSTMGLEIVDKQKAYKSSKFVPGMEFQSDMGSKTSLD